MKDSSPQVWGTQYIPQKYGEPNQFLQIFGGQSIHLPQNLREKYGEPNQSLKIFGGQSIHLPQNLREMMVCLSVY